MEENFTTKNSLIENFGFTDEDFKQIINQGVSLDKIHEELRFFETGISKIQLIKPATISDGIVYLTPDAFKDYASKFDNEKSRLLLNKFVPASGAATRMFKFLNEFLNDFNHGEESINAYINRKKDKHLPVFLAGIEKFPFYNDVKAKLKELLPEYYSLESHEKSYYFIKTLLSSDYFDYANKPKGVLDFHKYDTHIATPVEEHLNECAFYASSNSVSQLHFTVSENHESLFQKIISDKKAKVEDQTQTTLEVSYSYQDKATDTIAVNLDNTPFRTEDGKLMFRPGGHGALINNLNNLEADVVFIKNIDNVIQNHIQEIGLYKKGLAGILIEMQNKIFAFLEEIEAKTIDDQRLEDIVFFMKNDLNIILHDGFDKYTFDNKIQTIQEKLNRPIRICGMVKNEGEPGGGPFWVRDEKGSLSLQIVESSQVDTYNQEQEEIFSSATHFNPVDLVCGIKNYKGEKFNLLQYVDNNTGFIVSKNNNGKELKAYELPGLWNGAMAEWITIFVEVPLITFNPVKTVNDLLKPAHQLNNE